jgi:quercetin dioxygenase-like cupin family protein
MNTDKTIVRGSGEGDRRWFFGGGQHVWKVTGDETRGAVAVFEDTLERGKVTPLHHHPESDEIIYVLEGEIRIHAAGAPETVGAGGVVFNPRGVAHAFVVTSERARLLVMVTPATQPESFYRAASVPGDAGPVDFAKIGQAAKETGATVILGPPPFAKP